MRKTLLYGPDVFSPRPPPKKLQSPPILSSKPILHHPSTIFIILNLSTTPLPTPLCLFISYTNHSYMSNICLLKLEMLRLERCSYGDGGGGGVGGGGDFNTDLLPGPHRYSNTHSLSASASDSSFAFIINHTPYHLHFQLPHPHVPGQPRNPPCTVS